METVNELEIDYSSLDTYHGSTHGGDDMIIMSVSVDDENDLQSDSLQSLQVKQQLSSHILSLSIEEYNSSSEYFFL
jgi:hypothetical protein